MFVDQAEISVKAGSGGPGAVSFRREKYIPKGGADGGNGGDGGSVIAAADENVNSLCDFRGQHHWDAKDGEPGGGSQCSGKAGPDLVVRMPPGTMIFDAASGEMLADLKHGEQAVIARGRRGGWGNEHFKTSTNQTPRRSDPGEAGEQRRLRLELELISEGGIVGLSHVGR